MDLETSTQPSFREGSASCRIIEPLQLYDPLLVLLKVKLRLNDWWIITGWGILVLGLLLMMTAILPTERWNGRDFFSPLQLLTTIFAVFQRGKKVDGMSSSWYKRVKPKPITRRISCLIQLYVKMANCASMCKTIESFFHAHSSSISRQCL